jgi:phosphomevalonate kinase
MKINYLNTLVGFENPTEEKFQEFVLQYKMRVKYEYCTTDSLLFRLSNDGIFWTENFYFDCSTDFEVLEYQITYYMKYGELP